MTKISNISVQTEHTAGNFLRFLFVGGVIGLLSVIAVYVAGNLLQMNALSYAFTVASVYLMGAIASFIGHARISFRIEVPFARFGHHLLISATMAVVTAVCAAGLRSLLPAIIAGTIIPMATRDAVAFFLAALISAVLSFLLSRTLVFRS